MAEIITTGLIILITLLVITLLVCTYIYFFAFRSPRRPVNPPYVLPMGKVYEPYHSQIQKGADEMVIRPCEEITISAYDGLKLSARYYHTNDNAPIHIQMHGYKGSPFVDFCGGSKLGGNLGHNVLVVDQRAHGKSSGHTITFGIKERRDCLSWITYCNERFGDNIPIFLWGISMGAATVLMATDLELPENVVGILADCPYSSPKDIIQKVCKDLHLPAVLLYPFVKLSAFLFGSFSLDESSAVSAIKQTNIPILLFHGEGDDFVPCEMSRQIKAAHPEIITLETVPDAGHGLCYMVASKRYEQLVSEFIISRLQA